MNLIEVFLFFWIMSIAGWIMEVFVCSIGEKKLVNRGFLIGPYCPIYGFGCVILLPLSHFKNNFMLVFIISIVLCSILEYLTSYIMELLFKVRWWDYSNEPFNLNGRICLKNALAFGILGTSLVCYLNPFILNLFARIDSNLLLIISVIVFVLTLIDIIISFNVMHNIKSTISKLNMSKSNVRDATNDIKKTIKMTLLNKTYLYRRLVKAYNMYDSYRDGLLEKIDEYRKNSKKVRAKGLFAFVLCGLVTGLILGLFTHNFVLSIPLGFAISIIGDICYDKIKDGKNDR